NNPTPTTSKPSLCPTLDIYEAGGAHSCALSVKATVRCWGSNARGQLGPGYGVGVGGGGQAAPADVGDVDLGGVAIQVAAG
ncbi:unnamed protein product, partial [Discosporangium mesarthrocarpum]